MLHPEPCTLNPGELETLLDAYDRERRTLPAPVGVWEWGFTKSAETWNGRIAMVAIIVILLLEVSTGQSILSGMWVEGAAGTNGS